MGLPKEQCVERKKGRLRCCCNQVWTKNGGRIPWSVTAICEIFRIFYLMGKSPYERRFGMPFRRTSNTVRSDGGTSPYFCEGHIGMTSVWFKSLAMYILRLCLLRGRIWKGAIVVADVEELEQTDASEVHARRLNAKEVLTPMKGDNLKFPVTDGTVKTSGDQRLRTSTLVRHRSIQGESNIDFSWRIRRVSSTTSRLIFRTPDVRKLHRPPSRWTQSQTVHAERRIISYSDQVHRRHKKHSYITWCNDKENIDDCWNADGERELSDAWTGFTRFILLSERPPDGCTWFGRRLTRKQTTSRPDNVWPDMWKHMSDAAKSKAKQKWIIEKPKLDNSRQLRVSSSRNQMRNIFFRKTEKNACSKLEIPMSASLTCKTPINGRGETCRSIGKRKTNYACIVEADESMRIGLEGVPYRYHEDHIAAQEINSLSHYNLAHKFMPMPQALKKKDAKAAVEK